MCRETKDTQNSHKLKSNNKRISIIKPTRCTIYKSYFILEQHSTCWWTEGPSETCTVLFQNKRNFRHCASGWFYYRNTNVCLNLNRKPPPQKENRQLLLMYTSATAISSVCVHCAHRRSHPNLARGVVQYVCSSAFCRRTLLARAGKSSQQSMLHLRWTKGHWHMAVIRYIRFLLSV